MNFPAIAPTIEPVSYERLATVPLLGTYCIALFTAHRPRIFNAARRQRVDRTGPRAQVEMALRTIDGSLTSRLSLESPRGRSQVTMTVTRMLKAAGLVETVPGYTLASIDGTCCVRSLRWVQISEVSTLTRFARAFDLSKPDTAAHIDEVLSTLGALPVKLDPSTAHAITINDALMEETR